jgi:hypothetical protein
VQQITGFAVFNDRILAFAQDQTFGVSIPFVPGGKTQLM